MNLWRTSLYTYADAPLSYIGHQIGRFGPMIMFFYSLFLLRGKAQTMSVFIAGFMVQLLANVVLKLVARQPRPDKSNRQGTVLSALLDESRQQVPERFGFRSAHSYGMPSGHAQSITYCLAFVLAAIGCVGNVAAIAVLAAFVLITCVQRVTSRRHYVDQVIVGAAVGAGIAIYMVRLTRTILAEAS